MKVNLFQSVKKDIKYSSRCILTLNCFYGINLEVEVPQRKYLIIELKGKYWSLCDNGQEVNIGFINDESQTVGIPSSSFNFEIKAETMAYRIATAISSGYSAIDWNFNDMPDLEEGYGYQKR